MHILIVDDHDLYRQGLAQSLLGCAQILAISEADCLASARDIIHAQHDCLDIVILDHGLPDGNGITLLKELQTTHPLLPVAMLSAHEDMNLMRECIEAGALGFIPKSTETTILLSAVELMLAGGSYIPPSLYHLAQHSAVKPQNDPLTQRQEQVLALLRLGLSNKEIAYQLRITEATVKAHVTMILKHYRVTSRTMLLVAEDSPL